LDTHSDYNTTMAQVLQDLARTARHRTLKPTEPLAGMVVAREGRRLLNFSSNDYLGLSRDPRLAAAAAAATAGQGVGATASRLVCGTFPVHQALESALARFKGTDAALVAGSGFQTNAGVLAALLDPQVAGAAPQVFADRLIHASMYEGLGQAGARPQRFRHNDLEHLAQLLERHGGRSSFRMILTESVFSMDGDRADLPALAALARRHDAFQYVDEAHATGVLGPGGAGLCAEPGARGQVDLVMGTFGKALGGYGAFVAGPALIRDWLVNRCRSFIYSTALPPPAAAAALAALELLPDLDAERALLLRRGDRVRAALHRLGIDTLDSTTQIIPALMGGEAETLAAARLLEAQGILAVPIRPPTVPPGTGRLRLTLTAAHTEADLEQLLHAFGTLGRAGA